jgi:hypothetical protein
MGSPLSPALAIIICCYYESEFLDTTTAFKKSHNITAHGSRYIDDVFLTIIHNKNDTHLANSILKTFEHKCYHEAMTLELEPDNTNFKFLESQITIKNNKIHLSFYDKNADHLRLHKSQLFYQYQHYNSFTPIAQKKATVTSTLYRVVRFTSCKNSLTQALKNNFRQFAYLGYPLNLVKNSIRALRRKSPDAHEWVHASSILKDSTQLWN